MAESAPVAPPAIAGFSYVRPLGRGGFSSVYLYEQDLPRRMVAIKALNGGFVSANERIEFEAEADAMARLSSHPAIVSVFGAGVTVDGRPYLVMEHCPGSMGEQTRGRPAQLAQVLDVGVRLAGALETAHRAKVLHRDVKPSNVLIASTGRPLLTDFGIAILAGRTPTEAVGEAASIPWAAPEVLRSDTLGTVSTEIWSLAATLYTFAAGRSPFESTNREQNTRASMRARIIRAKYTPVPGAQGYEPFDAVMAKAMAEKPEQRFASMDEFAGALQQVQRSYGFDVTQFDMTRDVWATPDTRPVEEGQQRGTTRSSVRGTSRAEARAAVRAAQADRDGLLPDREVSPLRAGLIGAGATVALLAVVAGVGMLLGWF